jgi:membrane protein YqaA with SNARE-associated domain
MLEYIAAWMIALVLAMGVAYIAIDLFCLLSGEFARTAPETTTIEFVNRP